MCNHRKRDSLVVLRRQFLRSFFARTSRRCGQRGHRQWPLRISAPNGVALHGRLRGAHHRFEKDWKDGAEPSRSGRSAHRSGRELHPADLQHQLHAKKCAYRTCPTRTRSISTSARRPPPRRIRRIRMSNSRTAASRRDFLKNLDDARGRGRTGRQAEHCSQRPCGRQRYDQDRAGRLRRPRQRCRRQRAEHEGQRQTGGHGRRLSRSA